MPCSQTWVRVRIGCNKENILGYILILVIGFIKCLSDEKYASSVL